MIKLAAFGLALLMSSWSILRATDNSSPRHWRVFFSCGQSNTVGTSHDGTSLVGRDWDHVIRFYDNSGGTVPNHNSDGWRTFSTHQGGFGPERGWARVFAEQGLENIAVVKFARNGTSLHGHWRKSAGNLYPQFLSLAAAALEALTDEGDTYEIAGFFWFQGHSDSQVEGWSNQYAANLVQFASDLRDDLGAPSMAFIVGRSPAWFVEPYREAVRESQVSATLSLSRSSWVDADDTLHVGDNIHLTSPGKEIVGIRMAEAWIRLRELRAEILAPGHIRWFGNDGLPVDVFSSSDLQTWQVRGESETAGEFVENPSARASFYRVAIPVRRSVRR